ncbi:MAG: ferritin family protein, partial [Microvirga sp.]
MKSLSQLTEREVIALAIASEEEDSRIYQHFADRLRPDFPASAEIFDGMAEEERDHRNSLYDFFRSRFGEHLPPIRREDVRGFLKRRAVWWSPHLDLDRMHREAEVMELQAASFYEKAAQQTLDVSVRELFTKLAEIERGHGRKATELHEVHLTENAEAAEEHARKRLFVLQYVQPGLAGLIDGSVSTLAPLFAAAFATQNNWETFLVGMAAS